MINGFTTLIAGSLGLEEPWYVIGAKFNEEQGNVHIYVGIREDAVFACPHCGGQATRYGYENEERIWRHGDVMFYPCYVHCRRPRVKCPHCGVKQLNAPFERKNSRFTLLFEGYAMLILADMPVAKAARVLRCNEKSLASILKYWVNKAVAERTLEDVSQIAIDETSFRRGHKYVTVVIDALKRCVIDVEKGREKAVVGDFSDKLEAHGGSRERITAVTSDMSKSYMPGIAENFPNAINVIDKFHVKKLLNDALEKVRKAEQKQCSDKQSLFRGRRLFMIPKERLTVEQSSVLADLSCRYPKTGLAYRIVTVLDDVYKCQTPIEAEIEFNALCRWMRESQLGPMLSAAETLTRHKEKILAYFTHRITNAICEGINSMIQAAKRKARGFHTFEGFSSIIYLIAGKLQLAVPAPF